MFWAQSKAIRTKDQGKPNFIVPPARLPARPQDARELSAGGGGGSRSVRALASERRAKGGSHDVR